MQVRYGSYAFTAGTCRFGVTQTAVLNDAMFPYAYDVEFAVSGRLYGEGDAALSASELALRAALAVPFRDVGVLKTDGTPSATYFRSGSTIGGITITKGPNFSGTKATEYVLFREFEFTASFKLPIVNAFTALVSFSESMEYQGGGPEFVMQRAVNAPPQRQLVWQQTEYRLIQTGKAVGFAAYPVPVPPAFPGSLKTSPNYKRSSPERIGVGYWRYPVEWAYVMESASPLDALPSVWK